MLTMSSNMTTHSDTGRLQSILLKHPRDAFESREKVEAQWERLNYRAAPDLERAVDEYDRFVELFRDAEVEINFAPVDGTTTLDSIYVRDAALVTDRGAILCSMGKADRRAEPAALAASLEAAGIEVLGAIGGDGRLEGGDVVWLPENRIAVGHGYRTNDDGIRQLRELTEGIAQEIIVVPLPHWRGPSDVFHLMSMVSPVDRDAALVYSPLLPVAFRERLLALDQRLIEVPDEEFASMGCNVLALGSGRCLMLDGNPVTRRRLERAGIEALVYGGEEISRKGEGGPTCLTRTLLREK